MNEHVITLFKLTSKDIAQLTPKGNKRILDSRIQWARFYLTKSGMIKNSKKKSTITTQGVNFLKKHPTFFNKITLLEIPQFSEYMQETNLKAQKNYQKKHKVS